MSFIPKGWGEYPPEYDRKIHGYYNPSLYYGKRDTPFSEVKLGDLVAWFGRRKKTPRAIAQAINRAWWKHQMKWVQPVKPGPAFVYQYIVGLALFSFCLDYGRIKLERKYRYH